MKKQARIARKLRTLSQADYELLATFRHTLREFIHFSEEAALAAGVPPHQHQAMLIIRALSAQADVTVGQIAERLQTKPQSAVGLVNRMVQRGFVRKSADPADHRHVFVRLTAAGEKTLAGLSAAHKAEIARLHPVLQKILNQLNPNH